MKSSSANRKCINATSEMSLLFVTLILVFTLSGIQFMLYRRRGRKFREAIAKIPGPAEIAVPMIYNVKVLLLYKYATRGQFDDSILVYQEIMATCHLLRSDGLFKYWLADRPIIFVFAAELVESILSNPKQTKKSILYFALKPWLREGLVTSEGAKWRSRRRIITPAFHFNILNDFMPAFDAAATKLVNKLNDIKYSATFDISHIVATCTMDIICETAMGVDSESLSNDACNWVEMIDLVTKITFKRMREPWLWPERAFFASETGKRYKKSRDSMQKLSMQVILERKAEWMARMEASGEDDPAAAWREILAQRSSLGIPASRARQARVKMAFLDLMLYQHLVEKQLSLEDIQEEVDTFMFAICDICLHGSASLQQDHFSLNPPGPHPVPGLDLDKVPRVV